jgi:hypothetical protein
LRRTAGEYEATVGLDTVGIGDHHVKRAAAATHVGDGNGHRHHVGELECGKHQAGTGGIGEAEIADALVRNRSACEGELKLGVADVGDCGGGGGGVTGVARFQLAVMPGTKLLPVTMTVALLMPASRAAGVIASTVGVRSEPLTAKVTVFEFAVAPGLLTVVLTVPAAVR